jgi:hypothetical protein
MTKSAKQDPAKAKADEAGPEPGPETVAEAAVVARDDSAALDDSAVSEDEAKPDLDEVKRKFREALERKHGVHAEGQAKGGRDTGKGVHGAHGPAASRRSFRRKSG